MYKKLADIMFYIFRELYELLEERAEAINDSEEEVKEKVEEDIIQYIDMHKNEINIPREAYITFETEESVRQASQIISSKL